MITTISVDDVIMLIVITIIAIAIAISIWVSENKFAYLGLNYYYHLKEMAVETEDCKNLNAYIVCVMWREIFMNAS